MPLLIDDSNDEAKDNHFQQQQYQQKEEPSDVDTSSSRIPFRGEQEITQDRIEASPLPRRSGRQTHLPVRYIDYALMTSILNVVEPMIYNEANQYDEWRLVMKEEYELIIKNETWELVDSSRIG